MYVYFLGRPLSGKSTISTALHKALQDVATEGGVFSPDNVGRFSAGDMARKLAQEDPETAKALGDGDMAPADKLGPIIAAELVSRVHEEFTIVDGYPRYSDQFDDLSRLHFGDKLLSDRGVAFVNINVLEKRQRQRYGDRTRKFDNLDGWNKNFDDHTQGMITNIIYASKSDGPPIISLYGGNPIQDNLDEILRWLRRISV